jgi:hypothetical protein
VSSDIPDLLDSTVVGIYKAVLHLYINTTVIIAMERIFNLENIREDKSELDLFKFINIKGTSGLSLE